MAAAAGGCTVHPEKYVRVCAWSAQRRVCMPGCFLRGPKDTQTGLKRLKQ